MATTLSYINPKAVTMPAVASTYAQVNLPRRCVAIRVANASAGTLYFAYNGTEGGAIGTDAIRFSAATTQTFGVRGRDSIFLASTSASVIVTVTALFEEP